MITIWFEPHATTADNEAKRASGWNDVDLSEKGYRDALEIVERCKSRGIEIIFTSDLQRAVKTAIPAASQHNLPVYPDNRLRECDYGDFTLKDKELVETERSKRLSEPFPSGESYNQCMKRMASFLDYLKANFDGKTVMIIGHRATHFGLDHIINKEPLIDCVSKHFTHQPGWKYEF
ncbi:MAG: histidine phosphatase family protein [Candidatus Saccharibacteria bacterium]|nr:histidine phosphatase family protein [Candidatus Saccharibacteria bacterium]